MKEYEDMLVADQEFEEWNKEESEDEFCSEQSILSYYNTPIHTC